MSVPAKYLEPPIPEPFETVEGQLRLPLSLTSNSVFSSLHCYCLPICLLACNIFCLFFVVIGFGGFYFVLFVLFFGWVLDSRNLQETVSALPPNVLMYEKCTTF